LWRPRATRRQRFDFNHARRDSEEDFRLANWLLGKIRHEWLELRSHARHDESRYRHHRWREPFSDEVVHVAHRCTDRSATRCFPPPSYFLSSIWRRSRPCPWSDILRISVDGLNDVQSQ